MGKPVSRAELVTAVSEATAIVEEAIPETADRAYTDTLTLRVAALPEVLRELLDYEVRNDDQAR